MPQASVKPIRQHLRHEEEERLHELESIIQTDFRAFYRVGCALAEINAYRLYRGEFETFQSYVKKVWKLGRSRAYQLIDASKVINNLSTIVDGIEDADNIDLSTIVDKDSPLPVTESQARILAKLEPPDQRKAWKEAIAEYGGPQNVTAGKIGKIVTRMLVAKDDPQDSNLAITKNDAKLRIIRKFNSLIPELEDQARSGYTALSREDIEDYIVMLTKALENGEKEKALSCRAA